MTSTPDPSDLEPISKGEATYQRDEDGELIPETHAVETVDGWRRIKIRPTPKGEAVEYEERFGDQDDIDIEDLDEILNEKVVEPDLDWSNPDIKPGFYAPVLNKVMESLMGEVPSNQFHREIRAELEKRQAEGN